MEEHSQFSLQNDYLDAIPLPKDKLDPNWAHPYPRAIADTMANRTYYLFKKLQINYMSIMHVANVNNQMETKKEIVVAITVIIHLIQQILVNHNDKKNNSSDSDSSYQ